MASRKGYTMIELLVVIGLIGIIAVLIIPAYGKYRQKQEANNAAQEIRSDLRALSSAAVKMEDYAILEFTSANSYNIYEGQATYPLNPRRRRNLQAHYPRAVVSPASGRITFGPKGWVATTGNDALCPYPTSVSASLDGSYTYYPMTVQAPGLVTYTIRIYETGKISIQ